MATALQQRSGLRAAAGSRRGPLRVACVAAPPTPSRSPGSTGSVKKAMTMTEKILAKHSDKPAVVPGDNVWTSVDKLLTHDVCGPGTFGIFQKEFGENAQVWDPERVVIIPDHYIFTSDPRANRNVDILREMADKYNIKYFYDIKDRGDFRANPDYKGVCHVALAQEGHCKPGEVLFGTDSHTCNAGAFGQFATGVGNTDAGFILGTGKLLIKVPPTMRFALDGEMPPWLLAKDLILHIIGEISVAGATYRSMEFVGDAVKGMNMEERMTICNMVVEAGGKNGVIPADQTTFDYVESRTSEAYEPVYSDDTASFFADYRFDVSKLEPVVAAPHSPDNRKLARECRDVKIDRVYIGSCTGGKTEDFMAAAKLLHKAGGEVKVPTYLVPATQKVWADVYTLPVPGCDGKTAAQIFEAAGCVTPAAPSCAACLGGPRDTFARMNEPEVCVSTTNRNFPGRMGHKEGQIYLASPYTAAASALAGHVADPRDYWAVKATREKARREKLNECFEELARLCDPAGKMVRTDRISIVQDAIRAMGALRVENNQLRQLNKFLEERVRHLETARAQGMYQQHMMQQMALQQQQMAIAQQQMQQPMATLAPQQAAQPPAAQGGEQQQQQQQQAQQQVQVQVQQVAPAPSGPLPTASSAGELQPAGSTAQQQMQQQQPDAAQQAQQAPQQQAAPQQAQQAQQGAVVPPGMMLVPIPAGGAPSMPAAPYPAAHPYYGLKAEGSLDPGMTASGSGAVGMAGGAGGYMVAPAGVAPSMGAAAVPAMGSLPQVMPPNAPPVSWLPAPDISQDGKLRPPAA